MHPGAFLMRFAAFQCSAGKIQYDLLFPGTDGTGMNNDIGNDITYCLCVVDAAKKCTGLHGV